MGNRVKGKPKKKSIRAAIGSNAGSKRKLTRMGKRQKAEKRGLEASFIGRSQCLKLLQVTLKDFRRLCILKGIYPREPLGRVPGKKKGQTFYHIKDIRAIAHEPILEKFRDFRAFMKKVRRAAGRNEPDEAVRKNSLVPTYTLYHLVKERYPRFQDALADIDDALTLSYLFAALPAEGAIKPSVVNKAKLLVASWGAYCATTFAITKSFISVKGVYLEANIRGSEIRWIVPHSFTQFMPDDVDFRVMMTFFEFYETLLNFVLYKLYADLRVHYPFPLSETQTVGSTAAVLGSHLRSLKNALSSSDGAISNIVSQAVEKQKIESESSAKVDNKRSQELVKTVDVTLASLPKEDSDDEGDDEGDDDDDSVDVAGPLQAALQTMAEAEDAVPGGGATDLDDDAIKRKRLFAGLTFFLSREVPRGYLELVCLTYGAKVGWEGDDSPISMKDPSITHHIVDRPKLPSSYDSLPKSREFVQPQWIIDCANFMFLLPITRYALGATLPPHLSPWVDNEEEGYSPAYAEEIEKLKNGEIVDPADMEVDSAAAVAEAKIAAFTKDDEESGEDEAEEAEEESDSDSEEKKKKQEKRRKKEEEEAHALAKSMMNRKAAHLYGRMKFGQARKQAKVEELQQRRKEIESSREKDASGTTMQKQKVERLRKERKSIEDSYSQPGGSMKKSKKRRSS